MAIRNAHKKMVAFLAETAKQKKTDYIKVSLKKFAAIYNIQEYLEDDEELEFMVEDILVELSEYDLKITCKEDQIVLPQCGIVIADYAGDGEKVVFKMDPHVTVADAVEIVEA